MGQTRKRHYDRYTLAYKLQAVKLANHPGVMAKDVAESLGIHPVMLYRWCMEHRRGELKDQELTQAKKRIRELEKAVRQRDEELDILKKAQRFFEKRKT